MGIKNIAQGTRDFMLNPKLAIELIRENAECLIMGSSELDTPT